MKPKRFAKIDFWLETCKVIETVTYEERVSMIDNYVSFIA